MATDASVQAQNKETVLRDYEEVWNEGATESRTRSSTRFPTIRRRASSPSSRAAREALIDAVTHFRAGFPDFHDRMVLMVAENDFVCYLGEINGTQTGELFGQAPSGNAMRVLGISFFRFEDGQIIERWGSSTCSR